MTARLRDQVIVVTGASSGIGRATALELGRRGARLLVGGRDIAQLEGTVSKLRALGCEAQAVAGDLRNEEVIASLMESAIATFGHLDVLINNAGVGYPGTVAAGRTENWREMLETNVLALCIACREAVRVMTPRGGTIVNVSSLAGSQASPNDAVYAATKAAVNSFSDSLRAELAATKIRVQVIEPGQVITSFARNTPHATLVELGAVLGLEAEEIPNFEGQHIPEQFAQRLLAAHPERFLEPQAVASVIVEALTSPTSNSQSWSVRPPS